MEPAEYERLLKKNAATFGEVKEPGAIGQKKTISKKFESEENQSVDEEHDAEASYRAALARHNEKYAPAKKTSPVLKSYSDFRSAWYAVALKKYEGQINDNSALALSRNVTNIYKSLAKLSFDSGAKIELSSKEALKFVKTYDRDNLFHKAIKAAFLKIRHDQVMQPNGIVSGPDIKKRKLRKDAEILWKHLDIS